MPRLLLTLAPLRDAAAQARDRLCPPGASRAFPVAARSETGQTVCHAFAGARGGAGSAVCFVTRGPQGCDGAAPRR